MISRKQVGNNHTIFYWEEILRSFESSPIQVRLILRALKFEGFEFNQYRPALTIRKLREIGQLHGIEKMPRSLLKQACKQFSIWDEIVWQTNQDPTYFKRSSK